MGKFNRDDRKSGGKFGRGFGGKSTFGKSRSFGGKNLGRPEMFKAICDECGDECQIPFKPTEGRPVFCSNCFAKQNGVENRRPTSFGRSERSDRPRFGEKTMHQAVCDKCGEECEVPFRPTAGKPVYCSNCFEKTSDRGGSNRNSEEITEQIKMLNEKIDKLINMLTVKEEKQPEKKEKETKVKAKKTTTKKKK